MNCANLPEHMREGTRLYIDHGIEPGSFLTAVLENKLVEAVGRADSTNIAALKNWAIWLYNECPSDAWGSREKVSAWIKKGGLGKRFEP